MFFHEQQGKGQISPNPNHTVSQWLPQTQRRFAFFFPTLPTPSTSHPPKTTFFSTPTTKDRPFPLPDAPSPAPATAPCFSPSETAPDDPFFKSYGAGMGRVRLDAIDAGCGGGARGGLFTPPDATFQWSFGGVFASVGQVGSVGFGGISPASSAHDAPAPANYALPPAEVGARVVGVSAEVCRAAAAEEEEEEEEEAGRRRKGFRLRIKIKNQSLRRLLSGAIAGAVSRTAVAPLETIRTHLMVGSSGHSTADVFQNIMVNDGWTGLFRGNFVNVVRVAPSKAVEVR